MTDAPADSNGPTESDPEAEIRLRLAEGATTEAAAAVIRRYGPELLGYLHAVARTGAEAEDVFGDYCERLLRGLASFRGDSSLRTWSYRVVRNLLVDRRRKGARVAAAEVPEALSQVAAAVQTETATFLKTHVRDRLAEIRSALPEEDQTLLILRVDRQLGWSDVAAIMLDEADARSTARLRKRFERLVARLREALVEPAAGR